MIEVTSESTREEDLDKKREIYRAEIKVKEYFLFDPRAEYLKPPLQGYKLSRGEYMPIHPVEGRLPSQELGLHLEKVGTTLRLHDPQSRRCLSTPRQAQREAEAAFQRAEEARLKAEAEVEMLRRENERLRKGRPGRP